MKDKLTPDQIAMIVADWEDGELSTCEEYACDNCPLEKELPKSLVGTKKMTICDMLVNMSVLLHEVEHD